jgi:hypothetical protein
MTFEVGFEFLTASLLATCFQADFLLGLFFGPEDVRYIL